MTEHSAGPVITIELDPALAGVVKDAGTAAFKRDVAQRVTRLMESYGIPGTARLSLRTKAGHRAVRVFVDGYANPYPPSFLRRLWFGIVETDLHTLAFDGAGPRRYPDAWLVACANAPTPRVRRSLDELLRRLVEEAVSLRPSRLLTPAAVGLTRESDTLIVIARALVDRAVTLPPLDELKALLRAHRAAGRTPADTLEDLYARMRAPTVDVHLHRDLYDPLTAESAGGTIEIDDPGLDVEAAAAMSAIRDHRLLELGVRMPVRLVRSDLVEPDEIRVKLNDRLGPPIPVPGAGEVGVGAPAGLLEIHGIAGRPLVDAVTGHELTAIAERDAAKAEAIGLVPALPPAYIAGAFGRGVTPLAHRLLSVDEVEADLAMMEERFPSLVHGVLSRYSLTTLTQVLRELVREQVSIRDLWRILNAMLRFAELSPEIEFDLPDPSVGRHALESLDTPTPPVDASLVAFVRCELADRVAYDSGALPEVGAGPMAVYVTDDAFEARMEQLLAGQAGARTAAELARIRDSVWVALGESPPPEPVIMTGRKIRRALREALALELPGARVLAREEMPPGVELRSLAVLAPA